MKKNIIIIGIILLSFGLIIAGGQKTIFSSKSFTVSDAGTDTSSIIELGAAQNVEISTGFFGTDSIRVDIYVDGWYAGKWVNLVADSLKAVNATTTLGRGIILRGYGTNKIPGIERIRVRNTLQNGAVDDSSSLLYYNQYLIYR